MRSSHELAGSSGAEALVRRALRVAVTLSLVAFMMLSGAATHQLDTEAGLVYAGFGWAALGWLRWSWSG